MRKYQCRQGWGLSKGWRFGVLAVLLSVWGPVVATGQVRSTGDITGRVLDQAEGTLSAVTVTLTGEKLPQRSRSAVTNDEGTFRFVGLVPGLYELQFELQGFNTLRQSEVEVRVGQTTPVTAVMNLGAFQKTVQVVHQAPLIETKSPQLSTNFSEELVLNLPTERNLLDLMETTPGINDRGAYGAGGFADTEYYQGSSTSAYLLDGVDVSDLDSGATWVNPNYETIEEIQVVGIGASAEYGNFSGAVLNVTTKRGTNELRGSMSLYYTDSSLQGDNSGGVEDLKPDEIEYSPEATFTLGGPLVRERLFFFVAGGYTTRESRGYGEPEFAVFKQPHSQLKLDWLPGTRHSLSFMVNSDPINHENLGLLAGSGPEIAFDREFRSTVVHGSWHYVATDSSFLDLRYAGFFGRDDTLPVSQDAMQIRDLSVNRVYGSAGLVIENERTRHQVNASLTHYADDFLGSTHEFKFGVELERSTADNNSFATGGGNITIIPYGPFFLTYGLYNYAVNTGTEVDRISAFVQDTVRLSPKATLNVGLRYDRPELNSRDLSDSVAVFENLAVRLGLTYDFSGDATSVGRASYGRYFDKTVTGGFAFAVPGVADTGVYLTFMFDPYEDSPENADLLAETLFQPQNFLFSVGGDDLVPVESGLNSAYTDVFNIGFEKQLFEHFAFSVDYIYKRDRDFVRINTNTPHEYAPIEWTDPWLGNTITLYDQLDRDPNAYFYGNSDWAERSHHMVMLNLRRRLVGNWTMAASLVYQNSEGNDNNTRSPVTLAWGESTDPNFTLNPLISGRLSYNRPYQFKLIGTYLLPAGFRIGGDFRLLAGRNWNASVPISLTPVYRDSLQHVPLETRGSRQHESTIVLNLRVSKEFAFGERSRLELIADVFNVFNRANAQFFFEAPFAVYPISGEDAFGEPASLSPPRGLRLGARWSF